MGWVKLIFFVLVIVTIFTVFSFLDVGDIVGNTSGVLSNALPQFLSGLTTFFNVVYSYRNVMLVLGLFLGASLLCYVKNKIF